ncbi:MAG TPA: hypothetical protein VI248_03750 [Kineosporiaceae bacterium]
MPVVDPAVEHRPMLEAILADDAAQAGRCSRDHADHLEQAVRAVL